MNKFYRICLVVSLLSAETSFAKAVPGVAADRDFLAAREAFSVGDRRKFERAAANLRAHVLAPYVEFYALAMHIDDASVQDVRAFIARNQDTPLAEKLRAEYARALGKKARWDDFGAFYAELQGEDRELGCYGLQYRMRTDSGALAEVRSLWLSAQDLPPACDAPIEAAFAAHVLTESDLHARMTLANEAGNERLARELNERLSAPLRMPAKRLNIALRTPDRMLAKGDFKWKEAPERELALTALTRLARTSPTAARKFWLRYRDRLALPEARQCLAFIAQQGARRLQPEALDWYHEAEGALLTDTALAWKVRIALRAKAWPDVLAAIKAMSAPAQQEAAWRYWRGRALSESGRADEARAYWEALAGDFGYYGVLAAEELGQAVGTRSDPLAVTPEALAALEKKPAVQRMLKFYELGLRTEAVREWLWATRNGSDEELLTAAEFARQRGLYDRAINTADRTLQRHDFSLRYLTPYRDALGAASHEHGLDPALVYALVRQESRFVSDIRSSAGAVGLMQLMPPTAKWAARKVGDNGYRPSHIGILDVNVKLGAYYLRYVLDRLGGRPVLAAAAYNAGPGRALNWRAPEPLEGAIYVESIPFTETRDYVKKVLANEMFYAEQLGLPRTSLKMRLGVIPGRDSALSAADGEIKTESGEESRP